MGAALQGPSRPEERMLQARDTLSTDFKSMVSQVESNAGMQVGTATRSTDSMHYLSDPMPYTG